MSEFEEKVIAGLVSDPRRLNIVKDLSEEHFSDRGCKAIFIAARKYHDHMAMKGKVRYASRDAIERTLKQITRKRPDDEPKKVKSRARTRQLALKTLDELQGFGIINENDYLDAIDQITESWLNREAQSGLLDIVDSLEFDGAGGAYKKFTELASRLAPTTNNIKIERLDRDAKKSLIDYEKAKHTKDGIKIPTFDPMLNKVTSGGGKKGRLWLVAAYTKGGKAMPMDADILTPNGWKKNRDIRIGDTIINPEGGTTQVIGVYPQGLKPCYRVTFSDGTQTECCDEHLWKVNSSQRKSRGLKSRVMSLREIMSRSNRYFIPNVSDIDFDRHDDSSRPIDPYLLGLLIGDGSFRKSVGGASFSSTDIELVSAVRNSIPPSVQMVQRSNMYDYGFKSKIKSSEKNDLVQDIQSLGLYGLGSKDKFIPAQYLWASKQVRLSILQGVMDADGHQTDRIGAEFVTVSSRLADDVKFIAQSLGCIVRVSTKIPAYPYNGERQVGKTAYRLKISAPDHLDIFRLDRKLKLRRTKKRLTDKENRIPKRGIANVEYIGMKEQQCISVDSENKLYVTNDFIVTHNTQLAKDLIYHASLCGRNCAIVTSEQTTDDVRLMIVTRHSHNFVEGGLKYNEIEEGRLNPKHEGVFRKTVQDLTVGHGMGKIHYMKVPNGTSIGEVKSMLESLHQSTPLDVVMIDHTGLFSPTKKRENTNANAAATMMEIKDLALNFGDDGLWVIACQQISRDGYEKAEKRGGYYLGSDMANTAEAERSCDLMLYVYRDEELTDISELRIGVSIDRWGPGEIKGWNCMECFESSAIIPIKA